MAKISEHTITYKSQCRLKEKDLALVFLDGAEK